MFPRYRGRVGEYMWQKEMERLERYQDRPWERQSKESGGNPLFAWLFIGLGILAGLVLLSLL